MIRRTRVPGTRREGFSLAELMVVIVILGLLTTLVVPQVFRQLHKAKVEVVRAELATFQTALDAYAMENGGYPAELGQLLLPDASGYAYIDTDELPIDPWGNEYVYTAPDSRLAKPLVQSLGADGQLGGEGADRDLFEPGELKRRRARGGPTAG